MKIYFTAAITQKAQFGNFYESIVKALENDGHQVQHDHITEGSLDLIKEQTNEELVGYYRQAVKWITQCDVMVAEASFPSTLNIGHEITLALEKGKPVVVFYKKGFNSFFLSGLNSDKLFLMEYTEENLSQTVRDSVEYAKDQSDTRFNFFISPSLSNYLDWVSNTKKVPRSVYLRQLIEDDREKNQAYYDA